MFSLTVSRFFVMFASLIITIGLYLQMFKIYQTKSAKDFNNILIFSLIVNEFAWLNYGLNLSEWPIILISSANLPAVIGIGFGYFQYGKGE